MSVTSTLERVVLQRQVGRTRSPLPWFHALPARADVVVIGDGLIGLSTALALDAAGAHVVVLGATRPGAASGASAGLLIPALHKVAPAARPFFEDSLSRYPDFIARLEAHDPKLGLMEGIIERSHGMDTLHAHDAAVDNVRLVAALRAAIIASATVQLITATVARVAAVTGPANSRLTVTTLDGSRINTDRVVLAAGAWSPQVDGLPRALPVRPLKGQMIALGARVLTQAMMGDDVYLVPRGNETLVGATEDEGFDLTVSHAATSKLRDAAIALCPELASASVTRAWTGTRPITPDRLPILGDDPLLPGLVYATGHSKNGVLLAPATAAAIAALCSAKPLPAPIEAFSIDRF